MNEVIDSNSAAYRREARKKRILDNSESRLKLITGVVLPDDSVKSQVSDSELLEPTILQNNDNDFPKCSRENKVEEPPDFLNSKINGETIEKGSDLVVNKEQCSSETSFDYFIAKRLHYLLLAVLVKVLLYYKIGYLFYENIICPFYTLKIVEFFLLSGRKQEVHPNLLLLLCGIPNNVLVVFQKVYSTTTTLLADFFLYFFVFTLCNIFINGNEIIKEH